jgi:hypothetical protein
MERQQILEGQQLVYARLSTEEKRRGDSIDLETVDLPHSCSSSSCRMPSSLGVRETELACAERVCCKKDKNHMACRTRSYRPHMQAYQLRTLHVERSRRQAWRRKTKFC